MPELFGKDQLFKSAWQDPRWKELKDRLWDIYLIIMESEVGIDRIRDQVTQTIVFRYDIEGINKTWLEKSVDLHRGPITERFAISTADFQKQPYDDIDHKLWNFIYKNASFIMDLYGIRHSFTVIKKR